MEYAIQINPDDTEVLIAITENSSERFVERIPYKCLRVTVISST